MEIFHGNFCLDFVNESYFKNSEFLEDLNSAPVDKNGQVPVQAEVVPSVPSQSPQPAPSPPSFSGSPNPDRIESDAENDEKENDSDEGSFLIDILNITC